MIDTGDRDDAVPQHNIRSRTGRQFVLMDSLSVFATARLGVAAQASREPTPELCAGVC